MKKVMCASVCDVKERSNVRFLPNARSRKHASVNTGSEWITSVAGAFAEHHQYGSLAGSVCSSRELIRLQLLSSLQGSKTITE